MKYHAKTVPKAKSRRVVHKFIFVRRKIMYLQISDFLSSQKRIGPQIAKNIWSANHNLGILKDSVLQWAVFSDDNIKKNI
jgi:hypothetical protein